MKKIPSTLKGSCKHLFMILDINNQLEEYFCDNDEASNKECMKAGCCPMIFDELYGTVISVK